MAKATRRERGIAPTPVENRLEERAIYAVELDLHLIFDPPMSDDSEGIVMTRRFELRNGEDGTSDHVQGQRCGQKYHGQMATAQQGLRTNVGCRPVEVGGADQDLSFSETAVRTSKVMV